ncbi:hemagglutinin repeat-containing protein [Vreelandella zhaodongensis]|uniref:hemagglutinin repeat-containing protein n=1 Tax=Vreelandella zhaodongensis TaxID=1176240 RepID=UPI003EB73884
MNSVSPARSTAPPTTWATAPFSLQGIGRVVGLTVNGDNVDLSHSQTSAYDAGITAEGALNTDNAHFITHGDTKIKAQSLSNIDGTVYAGGEANLRVIGALTSTGTIAAANNLGIEAASVNSSGTLAAGLNTDGTLKEASEGDGALSVSTTGNLRASGNHLAAGTLVMQGNRVDVSGSQTSASSATLKAHDTLATRDATIVAQQDLLLEANGALDNRGGILASKEASLQVKAHGVNNTGGLMVVANALDINAQSDTIDNTSGELLAQGGIRLSSDADILNSGGLVQSNAQVSLIADSVDNRQTSESTQGIVGNHVAITASNVDNTEGQVLAGRDLTITADTSMINDSGTLNAQRALTLQDSAATPAERKLEISNAGGEIVANHDNTPDAASVTIAAKSLDLSGKLESGGDMSLDLVGDLHTAGGEHMSTAGVLSLQLQGDSSNTFTNAGTWQGGQGLSIRADNIINQSEGELRSLGTTVLDTTQHNAGSVTNRGLINGTDTRISSGTVNNIGSGRLYGDRIAIAANTLFNQEEAVDGHTQAATIAARERLDIGAQHITNREDALLFSGGDMAIGGALSNHRAVVDGSANAVTLNNNSATIESVGDMALATDILRNTNEHFVIEEEYLGETRITEIQPPGWGEGNRLTISENGWVDLFSDGWSKQFDNGATLTWARNEKSWKYKNTTPSNWDPHLNYEGRYTYSSDSHVGIFNKWDQYYIKRDEYEDRVTSSAPGLIRTGGNLTLRGEDLLNEQSDIIVGKKLSGDVGNLRNEAAELKRRVITEETSIEAVVRRVTSDKGSDAGVADWLDRGWDNLKHMGPFEKVTRLFSVGEVQENASFVGSTPTMGDTFTPSTASGANTGDSATAATTLDNQAASGGATEVNGGSHSTSDIRTDSTAVAEASVSAESVDRTHQPGDATTHANGVDTHTHVTNSASVNPASSGHATHHANGVDTNTHVTNSAAVSSANAGDATHHANGVDTNTHVTNSAAVSAASAGDAATHANGVDTGTHVTNSAAVNAASSGHATHHANGVDTNTHVTNSAAVSAANAGDATHQASGVDTNTHVTNSAAVSAANAGDATHHANGVDTNTHVTNSAAVSAANAGDATHHANGVDTNTHVTNSAAVSSANAGDATHHANGVDTSTHVTNSASVSSANAGDAVTHANGVDTEAHGTNKASFSAHQGSATHSANAVNTATQGASQASLNAHQGSATHSVNAVDTHTQGAASASLNAHSSSSTTQDTVALSTESRLLDHANPSQGAQATAGLGTQSAPTVLLPTSSLYTIDPGSNSQYLVATDPEFINHKNWLSSDYLLDALEVDHSHVQKRLGDGFYEQKLIRDQIAALTGFRFLGDYRSDDAQYADLMNAGAAFAHEHALRPGIALSPAQTAQLTNDIVWLVTQTVQLPDGSTTTALMPKVYLAPRDGDLATNGELLGGHHGALISAHDIDLTLSGDLNNSGTIAGRKLVDISAQNLNNSGYLQGDIALLNAQQDINLDGGQIAANTGMALQAGGDINIASTLHSATNEVGDNTFSLQGIDRVAGLYVNGEAGTLLASAGGAINLTAAQLHNLGSGATQLTAGSDITLDTLEIGQRHALNWDANNYHHQSHSEEIGSVITGGGAMNLTAGQDINLRAATVDAQGALALNAIGGDITLQAGQRTESLAEGRQTRSSGLFSSRTRTTRTSSDSTHALASELGGQTVSLISGQDIRVSGANIVADQDLGMHAGGNLTLDGEDTTQSNSYFSQSKKSGLFSGGFGINLGSQRQMTDATNTATFVAPTTVGSIGGNVTLTAGDTYTQIGSDVLAPSGDILIGANTVNILEGRETSNTRTEQRFKQGGLSLSLSNPVMDSAQGIKGQVDAAGNTDSPRMHALAAANSALAVKDIQQQRHSGQGTDLSLNISLGSSQSRSQSTAASNTARGSTLTAGGDLAIHALGEGDGEGTITVQGSQLDAGNQLQLNAAQDIHLLASADSASQHSSHRSSSGSIGLGVGTKGLALNLDANRAQGHGNGDSTTYTNSQLSAGNQVILTSGGDTALKGAVVSAPQITTHIGGKLTIESLQDSATHNERHTSSGASLSVPLIGGQPTASLDASRTKLNSDFQSVNEQSGLRAGDGGFQVNVGGTTTLNGGAITSTQAAIDDDRNTFTTAGQSASDAIESGALTLTDIGNRATYDAESINIGLSSGGNSGGNNSGESSTGLSGIGTGHDDGSASSTTVAAISGLAGNQDARTGDAESGLAPIFDADRVKRDVQAQATITQEFGSRASKEWGDYANDKWLDALERGDAEASACWAADGSCRSAGHLLIGGATGGVDGALGAGVSTQLAPQVLEALQDSGLPQTAQDTLAMLMAATAGSVVGGQEGAAAGYNEAANNAAKAVALCRVTPACASALSSVLGVSAATAMLNDEIALTGNEETDLLAAIAMQRAAEAALFVSDLTGGERTEYPAETEQLPISTESPAQPIDRPGRYDTPIVEQEAWTTEQPVTGPAYNDQTSEGGYQILDAETQQLIGGAVYSEGGDVFIVNPKPGQVASPYPPDRIVSGRREGVRSSDPLRGYQESGAWDLTAENLVRMERGAPPIGRDGASIQLHHRNQNPAGPLDEVSATTHRTIDHPIRPSQIDRDQFAGERRRYWVERARELLGQQ